MKNVLCIEVTKNSDGLSEERESTSKRGTGGERKEGINISKHMKQKGKCSKQVNVIA